MAVKSDVWTCELLHNCIKQGKTIDRNGRK